MSNDEKQAATPTAASSRGASSVLPSFKCVIEIDVRRSTRCSASDGVPLRATVTLKLKEADTLSTKDAECTGRCRRRWGATGGTGRKA